MEQPTAQPNNPSVASRFSTKLTNPETILVIALFLITVTQFSMWGKTAVEYLLSSLVNIKTESTIYDVFIGFIAMISSVLIFIGGIYAWNLKKISSTLMMAGAFGFLIKNMFDIVNDVVKLTNIVNPKPGDIQIAATAIGGDLFQTAFWIFVIVIFTRVSFKSKLS
jgi:hypothetical protein